MGLVTFKSTFLSLKRKIIWFIFCRQNPVIFECEIVHLSLYLEFFFFFLSHQMTALCQAFQLSRKSNGGGESMCRLKLRGNEIDSEIRKHG